MSSDSEDERRAGRRRVVQEEVVEEEVDEGEKEQVGECGFILGYHFKSRHQRHDQLLLSYQTVSLKFLNITTF